LSYLITYAAMDAAGNHTTGTGTGMVLQNRR
jgi:hypothetical protein